MNSTAQLARDPLPASLPIEPSAAVEGVKAPPPWHKRLALVEGLSPTAHHVLLCLGSFVCNEESDAWPSVATLAGMSGRSGRVIQRSLREIERAGILLTSPSIAGTSRYRLRPVGVTCTTRGGDVRDRGGVTWASPKGTREGTREARTSATSRVRRKYEDASTGPRQRLEALPVPDPGPAPTDEQRRELLSNIKTRLEALPKSEYPGVVKARSELDNWRKAGCPTEGFIIPFVRPSETEPITGSGCPDCGAASIIGGACAAGCGYDEGGSFSPNPDFNGGH